MHRRRAKIAYTMIAEIKNKNSTGLCTDSPATFSVMITAPEDIYNPERVAARGELERHINSSALRIFFMTGFHKLRQGFYESWFRDLYIGNNNNTIGISECFWYNRGEYTPRVF